MLKKYAVPLAYVDGQKLVGLARDTLAPKTERAVCIYLYLYLSIYSLYMYMYMYMYICIYMYIH